jgi:predicted phosphoribosyltransferase
MNRMKYKDRVQAGRQLAAALGKYGGRADVVVLGLPRGGVPVAAEVAKTLRAPLDVMVVRKLGVPGWEELAMGAIAAGGVRVLNDEVVRSAHIPPSVIESVAAEQLVELQRRELAYRGDAAPLEVRDKTVILVDDGIATGSTIRAAAQALRHHAPARIVIAAPVGARESCEALSAVADEVVVPHVPEEFRAVGQWYANFDQTSDEEVGRLLGIGKAERAGLAKSDPALTTT